MMGAVSMQRRIYTSGGIFALLLLIGIVMPGSFAIQQPGPALDVTGSIDDVPLVDISGMETFDSDTHYFTTTVSQQGNPDGGAIGGQAFAALLDPQQQLIPIRAIYSRTDTSEEIDSRNAAMMTNSQDTGTVAALEAAGLTVPMTLTVTGVVEGSPNAGVFEPGDVIKTVTDPVGDDKAPRDVVSFSALTSLLATLPAGTELTIGVERDGKSLDLNATTMDNETDSTGWTPPGSRLGIGLAPSDIQFPVDVTYGIENIGGPSAGSMFALEIYDRLTPGSLGGDNLIAGTGTMSLNGEIGPIGGIAHKLVGASRQGAEYFLAPATNCAETVGHEPAGMQVFAVRNIKESIAATEAIAAGDTSGLTTCKAVADAAPKQESAG